MRNIRNWSLGLASALLLLGVALPVRAFAATAWLGVSTQEVSDELRDGLDLRGDGVLITSVVAGSPADRAGIRKGDVLTSFNGQSIESPSELFQAVRDEEVGSNATVKVVRRGATQTFTVRLGTRPSSIGNDDEDGDETPTPRARPETRVYKNGREVDPDEVDLPNLDHLEGLGAMPRMMMWNGRGRLGVRIESMNSDLGGYFGGSNGKGALIVEVIDDSPAEKAGLRAGDVIVRVGNNDISDSDDLVRTLRNEEGRVVLTIVRRGSRQTVAAELEETRWRDRGNNRLDLRTPRAPRAPGRSGDESDAELRRQLDEMREELRDMKRQLEEERDKNR